jgi:hypothetical protein
VATSKERLAWPPQNEFLFYFLSLFGGEAGGKEDKSVFSVLSLCLSLIDSGSIARARPISTLILLLCHS